MCGCRLEIELTKNFFLRCHFYHVERLELLNSLHDIDLAMILLLILFYLAQISIIKRQIEKFFLTVLLISKLLKDMMNHFYDHRQQVSCFCVMCVCICIYIYIYICIFYVCMYIYMYIILYIYILYSYFYMFYLCFIYVFASFLTMLNIYKSHKILLNPHFRDMV